MAYTHATSGQPGKYDVWSEFLHELCHVVGLAHPTSPSVPTKAAAKPVPHSVVQRSIWGDDVNGLIAIGY